MYANINNKEGISHIYLQKERKTKGGGKGRNVSQLRATFAKALHHAIMSGDP